MAVLSMMSPDYPLLPSEDYSAGSEKCEGLCCNDDTVPYQPTEGEVLFLEVPFFGKGV